MHTNLNLMIDAPKDKRGPTKLGMIQDCSPSLSIEFNDYGQPVGVNSYKYALLLEL